MIGTDPPGAGHGPESLAAMARRMRDGALRPKELGTLGERYAAAWLERQGWRILDRNWRSRYGELDIVAATPERVVAFVEVKTRRSLRCGPPQEAVDPRKRACLRRAGAQWLLLPEHRLAHRGVRFDVVSILVHGGVVRLHHIPEAF